MSNIDWSNAQDSDTHYDPLDRVFVNFDAMRDWHRNLIPRPTPQWSGLPPVGIDIEVMHGTYGWIGARVVGADGEAAIVRTNDGYAGVFPHEFRPIRTPEQIAADEREAAIEEMKRIWREEGFQGGGFAALYDAGLRLPKGDAK